MRMVRANEMCGLRKSLSAATGLSWLRIVRADLPTSHRVEGVIAGPTGFQLYQLVVQPAAEPLISMKWYPERDTTGVVPSEVVMTEVGFVTLHGCSLRKLTR